MKKQIPAWAALCIVALAAGLLLGLTNEVTASQISKQTEQAADAARKSVLPEASEFMELTVAGGAAVTNCYEGKAGGASVGYTAQVAVKGYAGEIEVIVGMSADGVITGISVGGPNFAETAGLGSKAREPWFAEQFRGVTPPVAAGANVDAITSATVTSTAVIGAVNTAADYLLENHIA